MCCVCYDHSTRLLDSLANERKTGVRWHQHDTSAGCIARGDQLQPQAGTPSVP
jgi:hypothetical protein